MSPVPPHAMATRRTLDSGLIVGSPSASPKGLPRPPPFGNRIESDRRATEINRPTKTSMTTVPVPPRLRKGNAMPLFAKQVRDYPRFTRDWAAMTKVAPDAINIPKGSGAR